jgi:glycosyltransferase involved in cell wall biosynthesis
MVESGRTGLLLEPGNVDELATAMVSLLRSRSAAETMGVAGRARAAELFSRSRLHRDWMDLLERNVGYRS